MSAPPTPPPGPAPAPVPQALTMPSVQVNLLPDSIRAAESAHRARVVAGGIVVGALVIAGGLYVLAVQDANAAQEELDAALAVQSQLQVEALKYAAVPEAYDTVAAAQASLSQAMAADVRWSFILNDLSLTIPDGVGLKTMNAGFVPAAADAATADPEAETVIGTLSYTGEARSYDDVAAWLDSQSQQEIYSNPYFTDATTEVAEGSTAEVVTFTSTVDVTDAAYSGRYGTPTAPPADTGTQPTPTPSGSEGELQ